MVARFDRALQTSGGDGVACRDSANRMTLNVGEKVAFLSQPNRSSHEAIRIFRSLPAVASVRQVPDRRRAGRSG